MAFGYADTRIWRETLAACDDDPYRDQRAMLAAAYHKLRERAAVLAGEIAQDLREFTVHDATHLDALWELSDTIAGPDLVLTPTEAFVLGAAFMVHDLGMGLAAWPGGLDELRTGQKWRDVLAGEISRETGKSVSAEDLAAPSEEVLRRATETLLREQHAKHGERLATVGWTSLASGEEYHLIEDPELRNRFGTLIGEVAASHGWDLADVAARFGDDLMGAPVDCPDDWTVDALKLACLLRVGDAAHLDERRAPGFLRTIRRPSAYSDLHWAFQGHLQRAHRVEDRLVFTSSRPFNLEEADAWWLGFDALRMVDRELASVDLLLRERGRRRFAARGVKGADSPARMSEMVRASGWEPVNAEVKVSNVSGLVRKLGGETLYGDHPRIALRELIQNARDATRAYSALLNTPGSSIEVRLERKGDGDYWLYVNDSGIGMSRQLMTGPLLDFGSSYWGSDLMRVESTGLAAAGFSSVGRFGIGFYSVFMLGDVVEVVSRRFDEASAQTKVLTFSAGTGTRPVYRAARDHEIRHVGGTSVRVKLRLDPYAEGGLLCEPHEGVLSLAQCVSLMAPALDVDLTVRELDALPEVAVAANDWVDMDPAQLLRRLSPVARNIWAGVELPIETIASRMRTIEQDGAAVARLSIAPSPPGVVDGEDQVRLWAFPVIGGLNTNNAVGGIAGIVAASATTADRLNGELAVSSDAWRTWASEQAVLWATTLNESATRSESDVDGIVNFFFRLQADTDKIFVARTADGLLDMAGVREWMVQREEVVFASSYAVDVRGERIWHRSLHVEMKLGHDVLLGLGVGARYGDWDSLPDENPDKEFKPEKFGGWDTRNLREWYYWHQLDSDGVLLKELANAWGQSLADILSGDRLEIHPLASRIGVSLEGAPLESVARWRLKRA